MRVRDLRDIPLLFTEGEDEMGAPKKTRAQLLDKIIQFIWDYQDRHNGETPKLEVIGRHVGVAPSGMGYYAGILVDDGRINRISVRPFRATLTTHKDNQRAIESFKRLRDRIERANEHEREQIRERQEQERVTEQRVADKSAVFAAAGDTVVDTLPVQTTVAPLERPAIAKNWDRQMGLAPHSQTADGQKLDAFDDAQARLRAVNKEVKSMMPRLLKIADERDLVFELVSRGYRVDKVR